VFWSFHHTIVDWASLGILYEDFAELYSSQLVATPAKLARPARRFSEFADWERNTREPALERYWRARLARPAPTERPVRAHPGESYGELTVLSSCVLPAISAPWMRALARRAALHRASVAMLLGAAVLSARVPDAGCEVTLRVVHANRDSPAFRFTCGCLMDFMPVRVSLARPLSMMALLERVRDAWLEALLHRVCFARIAESLTAAGLPAQQLFDVGLNWMPGGPSAPKRLGGKTDSVVLLSEASIPAAHAIRYDRRYAGAIPLEFVLQERSSGAVTGYLAADASLAPLAVAGIAERFMASLRSLAGSADEPLSPQRGVRC
jgi:hypothetical protein